MVIPDEPSAHDVELLEAAINGRWGPRIAGFVRSADVHQIGVSEPLEQFRAEVALKMVRDIEVMLESTPAHMHRILQAYDIGKDMIMVRLDVWTLT